MANSILSFFNGGSSGSMLMQAFGAMMRGESPQQFMQALASSNPALRGINLNDINGEAQRICRERGVDPGKLEADIKQQFDASR